MQTEWYVVVRRDNGYPMLIFADRKRAEHMAKVNGSKVVPVRLVEGNK